MKIAIGADHNGYDLKEAVKTHIEHWAMKSKILVVIIVQRRIIQMLLLKLVKASNKEIMNVVFLFVELALALR